MRHSPSIEPPTTSHQSLDPKLQRALSCLDVRLEAELTRYRRQRFGRSISPPTGLKLKQPAKVELMAISGQTSPAINSENVPSGYPLPALSSIPINAAVSEPTEPISNSYLAVASQLPEGSITASEAEVGSGDISLRQTEENTHNLATDSTPPDDYLESSEELLRSLAREEAQVRVERSFLESLATPLGVGSMLMLLLSSAMFGYVIMNPSSLGAVAGLFDRTQSTPAASPATVPVDPNAPIPNSPPLDKQEFVDLGLDDLTTLNSRRAKGLPTPAKPLPSTTAPAASASATQAERQSNDAPPQTVINRGTRTAPVQSAPPASDRSPAPRNDAPAPVRSDALAPARSYAPAPIKNDSPPVRSYSPMPPALPPVSVPRDYSPPVQSAPAAGGGYSYKVQIPYTGDQSLEDARRVAPDAYLRPDGNIQLGAMGSEAEAKAKAQELQTQGIQAEVHQR